MPGETYIPVAWFDEVGMIAPSFAAEFRDGAFVRAFTRAWHRVFASCVRACVLTSSRMHARVHRCCRRTLLCQPGWWEVRDSTQSTPPNVVCCPCRAVAVATKWFDHRSFIYSSLSSSRCRLRSSSCWPSRSCTTGKAFVDAITYGGAVGGGVLFLVCASAAVALEVRRRSNLRKRRDEQGV